MYLRQYVIILWHSDTPKNDVIDIVMLFDFILPNTKHVFLAILRNASISSTIDATVSYDLHFLLAESDKMNLINELNDGQQQIQWLQN